MTDELTRYLEERHRALLNKDLDWVAANIGADERPDQETLEHVLHVSRLAVLTMPMSARRESAEWLKARGLKDALGNDPMTALEEPRHE